MTKQTKNEWNSYNNNNKELIKNKNEWKIMEQSKINAMNNITKIKKKHLIQIFKSIE